MHTEKQHYLIIDTNICLSLWWFESIEGLQYKALLQQSNYQRIYTTRMLEEFKRVLNYPQCLNYWQKQQALKMQAVHAQALLPYQTFIQNNDKNSHHLNDIEYVHQAQQSAQANFEQYGTLYQQDIKPCPKLCKDKDDQDFWNLAYSLATQITNANHTIYLLSYDKAVLKANKAFKQLGINNIKVLDDLRHLFVR